jgi:hypothetical protein
MLNHNVMHRQRVSLWWQYVKRGRDVEHLITIDNSQVRSVEAAEAHDINTP